MKRRTLALLLALTATAGLTGCSLRSGHGALIGAGVGALAGSIIDYEDPGRGALIGAGVGALGGYAVTSSHNHAYHSGYHYRGHDRGHRRGHYEYRGHRGRRHHR